MLGLLAARLPEAKLEEVEDPRDERGRRWSLRALLTAAVVGVAAGCKSLLHTEALTAEMSGAVRRRLGLVRRIPDTTMRTALVQVAPSQLRRSLRAQVKAAHRRKALEPDGLPFGVMTVDGKSTTSPTSDGKYAQKQTHSEGGGSSGLVRTLTFSLVSSVAKVCMDAVPIPPATNEMGHFLPALRSVLKGYGRCRPARLVTYDAGACSEANGQGVRDCGLHYLFGLKGSQPTLLLEAQRLLSSRTPAQAEAETVDVESNERTVTRRLYRTDEMAGFLNWAHLRTVLRVESVTEEGGRITAQESRYFLSSLPMDVLSPRQWLLVVRSHWAVENNCHNTWDTVFEEDDHPWIRKDPQGMVVVMLLRRIAYNLLALFRSVTQRSDERRHMPWRDLLRWLWHAVLAATEDDCRGLRAREASAAVL